MRKDVGKYSKASRLHPSLNPPLFLVFFGGVGFRLYAALQKVF